MTLGGTGSSDLLNQFESEREEKAVEDLLEEIVTVMKALKESGG
jgi:hypothetical protein